MKRLEIRVGAIATTLCRDGQWGDLLHKSFKISVLAVQCFQFGAQLFGSNYALERMDGTHGQFCLLY